MTVPAPAEANHEQTPAPQTGSPFLPPVGLNGGQMTSFTSINNPRGINTLAALTRKWDGPCLDRPTRRDQ